MKNKKITFSFGRNWVDYVNNFLDEKKIDIATDSLLKYLPEKEHKDKVFVDVGCGSGIFSLSAARLGCKKVVSFDVDKYSIEATKIVKEKFSDLLSKETEWEIFQGSVLDKSLIEKLKEKGDIVYSWGVLHHTGSMHKAIKNTVQLVKPSSYLILAIYNRAPSSDFWLKVKKFYNRSPFVIKMFLVYSVFFYKLSRCFSNYFKAIILRKEKPFKLKNFFERERGMSIFYDVVDWLGGYPYEYASFKEIKNFVEKQGFKLIKSPTKILSPPKKFFNRFSFGSTGNNEFVFQKNETN